MVELAFGDFASRLEFVRHQEKCNLGEHARQQGVIWLLKMHIHLRVQSDGDLFRTAELLKALIPVLYAFCGK